MKTRRKSDHCLNCQLELDKTFNYCPQCGQENTNHRVTLGLLLRDLADNYISLDSRLLRSIVPFLFRPGALTNAFNKGNRMKYIHPVRFYLIVSVIYFFLFARLFQVEKDPLQDLIDSSENREVSRQNDSTAAYSKLAALKKPDSAKQKIRFDRELKVGLDREEQDPIVVIDSADTTGNRGLMQALRWLRTPGMTEEAFLDSMKVPKTEFKLRFAHQAIKVAQNDLNLFIQGAIDNISVMMIIMLPLFALYLKLFYIRSGRLYIEHLVCTFNLQTFVYFIGILMLLTAYVIPNHTDTLILTMIPCIIGYNLFTFRNVYAQSWLKTFLKVSALSFLYCFTLSIFLFFEFLASFLLY